MKRQCQATTKTGNPCKARPIKNTDYCLAHADEETRASVGFGGSRAGALGGRPALPKPTDLARQLIERNVAAVLRPHFKALGLMLNDDGTTEPLGQGAILTGESKDGVVIPSTVEDLGAQIAAAEKLLDRIYGRPKQATEISGPAGGPVEHVTVPAGADRASEVAKILAEAGAAVRPRALNGNGNGNGNGHH